MKHFVKAVFLGILLLSLEHRASAQPASQFDPDSAECQVKKEQYNNCVKNIPQSLRDYCQTICSDNCVAKVECVTSAYHVCRCEYLSDDCLTPEWAPDSSVWRYIKDRSCKTIRSLTNLTGVNSGVQSNWGRSVSLLAPQKRAVIASPLVGAGVVGTEAKIVTPPVPSPVADLVAEQTEQAAQQQCADGYLQCFRECSNGTEPLIKADDPNLNVACQNVRDPKNAALVCNSKAAGCVMLTCNKEHQNPLDQKAAGYLACPNVNASLAIGASETSQSICSPLNPYWGSQQVADFMDFAIGDNVPAEHTGLGLVGLFVKAAGRQSEQGCAVMSQDTPLFHCVSACWGAPYAAARCAVSSP
jgi:hypothetical protein